LHNTNAKSHKTNEGQQEEKRHQEHPSWAVIAPRTTGAIGFERLRFGCFKAGLFHKARSISLLSIRQFKSNADVVLFISRQTM
jgi:hypothetical protein